jgi:hypothetical protein
VANHKKRNNIALLYRTYSIHSVDYNTDGSAYPSSMPLYNLILTKNGKKIRNVDVSFSKRLMLKMINKRYQQSFRKKDFKNVDAMIDYIMNMESNSKTS